MKLKGSTASAFTKSSLSLPFAFLRNSDNTLLTILLQYSINPTPRHQKMKKISMNSKNYTWLELYSVYPYISVRS